MEVHSLEGYGCRPNEMEDEGAYQETDLPDKIPA